MPTITVCFLRSDSPQLAQAFVNTAAAWLAPTRGSLEKPMIHCEVLLPSGPGDAASSPNGRALSVCHGGKTFFFDQKTFSRDGWYFVSVPVTQRQVDAVESFARDQVDKPFNTAGYYAAAVPCVRGVGTTKPHSRGARDSASWFCSELCSAALAAGPDPVLNRELVASWSPHLHPHNLWMALQEADGAWLNLVPTKISALRSLDLGLGPGPGRG